MIQQLLVQLQKQVMLFLRILIEVLFQQLVTTLGTTITNIRPFGLGHYIWVGYFLLIDISSIWEPYLPEVKMFLSRYILIPSLEWIMILVRQAVECL